MKTIIPVLLTIALFVACSNPTVTEEQSLERSLDSLMNYSFENGGVQWNRSCIERR